MRILIEPMGYHVLNLGDVAMRQIAVRRLRALWPDARIEIFADDPAAAAQAIPGAEPLSTAGRRHWFYSPALGPLVRLLPERQAEALREGERALRRRAPRRVAGAIRLRHRGRGPSAAITAFLDAVQRSDLLVVSGGGALNDHYARPSATVLDVVELAIGAGVPTAMLGQGVGPLADGRLARRLAAVLPSVELLGLREDVAAAPILARLGATARRTVTTGDDALELAYERARDGGGALGVNLRISGYARLGERGRAAVARGLAAVLSETGAAVVPLPVSRHPGERDHERVLEVLDGSGAAIDLDGGEPASPRDLVERIGRCRVVVTGSYHAAVFALGQGIPAVGLVTSPYYEQKFAGLRGLFGRGAARVDVLADDADENLAREVGAAWAAAEELRPELLASAARQVGAARSCYELLRDVVGGRR